MVSVKVGDLLRNHPQYRGIDATVAAICGNVMFLTTGMGGLHPELIDPWPSAYLPPAGAVSHAGADAPAYSFLDRSGRQWHVGYDGRLWRDGDFLFHEPTVATVELARLAQDRSIG